MRYHVETTVILSGTPLILSVAGNGDGNDYDDNDDQ